MASVHLDIDFRTSELFPRGVAWITVGGGYYTTDNGVVHLSHDCVTELELDFVIDQMKRDLDDIRRRAKSKFAAAAMARRNR